MLGFMKLILTFTSITKKKIDLIKRNASIFYLELMFIFPEYLSAVQIDEKTHKVRELIFEEKRQKALTKNLVVNLLELI